MAAQPYPHLTLQDIQTDEETDLESDNSLVSNPQDKEIKKHVTKKLKQDNSSKEKNLITETNWENLENLFKNTEKSFLVDFLQVREFFEVSKGLTNVQEIAQNFTKDLKGFVEMLKEIHPCRAAPSNLAALRYEKK